jgi:hypothetical protein
MQTTIQGMPTSANPLSMFMRQPKIYIKFPSGGRFWPTGSLLMTDTGDFPVYSMTAKDELMLKVPDALMNGQAVVDVIQNCIPNIKNAWHTPSIDMDFILIAIRLATYGEKMETPLTFGGDLELKYEIDLRMVMDSLMNQIKWDPAVPINDSLTIFVKPLTYKYMSEAAIQTFQTERLMQVINDDKMDEDTKIKLFKESFSKLSDATVGVIHHSISKIDTINGSTDDSTHIKEFINNVDKDVFNKVQKHLENMRDINAIKPMIVQVTDEMREKGIEGDTVEIPLTFDPSTFFV